MKRSRSQTAIFVCGWVVFIENEISDIDGNYAVVPEGLRT